MATQITWHGKELLAAIRAATPDGLFAAGELLIDLAASKAPKASGDLANSGYVTGGGKSTYRNAKNHNKEIKPRDGEVIAAFAAFYAKFVELGTKTQSARPFLRPALDESRDELMRVIVSHAGKPLK